MYVYIYEYTHTHVCVVLIMYIIWALQANRMKNYKEILSKICFKVEMIYKFSICYGLYQNPLFIYNVLLF